MSLAKDFREFLLKQNALALAVAVVIGTAVGKVISAIVDDLIMPVVGILLPGGEWRSLESRSRTMRRGKVTNAIKYGDLLGRMVDFLIIALVVFFLTKALLRTPPCADEELPAMYRGGPHRRHPLQVLHERCLNRSVQQQPSSFHNRHPG